MDDNEKMDATKDNEDIIVKAKKVASDTVDKFKTTIEDRIKNFDKDKAKKVTMDTFNKFKKTVSDKIQSSSEKKLLKQKIAKERKEKNEELLSEAMENKEVTLEIGGTITNNAVVDYISKNIIKGEKIIGTAIGVGGDYLLATNKKVVILKKGIATWATGGFGMKAKSHMLSKINSIDITKGLMYSELEIVSAGTSEKSKGGFFKSAASENIFQIEKKYYNELTVLVNRIREYIELSTTPNATISTDIPEQIKRLSELRDQGILTEEEFLEKKKALLNKL